jgi:predicted transposase/invertase (TIGR01784 family)
MRRDSIFYALFQRSPNLLFELLETPPALADQYRFESIAVKEPKFEIDGVFLPPQSASPGTVFFAEVQFQKDEKLYERLFGELFLYFYRNRQHHSDWQAVIIYPSRQQEQSEVQPYQMLLKSDHVHRIYLKELGDIEQLPLGIALMVLTTMTQKQAPGAARSILNRSLTEPLPKAQKQVIIDMVGTIITYKFSELSREEINKMLGIALQETRVYQEAREEERRVLVLKMLQEGATLDFVIKVTGLSESQIQQIQTEIDQN